MSTTKTMPLNWYSSMKKKLRKIQIIFDIKNWLWKSEIGIFQSLDLERTLIYHFFPFYEKVLFSTPLSYHLMRKLLKNIQMLSSIHSYILDNYIKLDWTTLKRLECNFPANWWDQTNIRQNQYIHWRTSASCVHVW